MGIATSIINAEGLRSEVRLDPHNRVKTLLHNGKPVAGFLYDSAGRVSSIRRHNSDSTVDLSVARNMENGATRIAGSDGSSVETVANSSGGLLRRSGVQGTYEYSPKGDLKSITQDGRTTTYSHNADGQVETITDPNGTAVLAYYPDGKVRSIQFHDGSVHEYNHSTLGFRKSIKRNDGTVKTFEYDVAGNLIRTDGPNADGQSADQRVELDKYHRPKHIDYSDGKRLSVTYDAQGNPLTVRQWFPGSNKQALALSPEEVSRSEPNVFEYLYDATNRIVAVQVGDTISGTHEYTDAEPDLRNQHDHKTMRASAATIRQSASIGDLSSILYARPTGSFFDVVRYDETLRMFEVPAAGISMPDAVAVNSVLRRNLPEGRSAERVQERIAFDQASNVIFLPPEYDTINCVPPNCVFTGIKISGNGVYNSVSVYAGDPVNFHATKQKASQCQHGVIYTIHEGSTQIAFNWTGQVTRTYPFTGNYTVSACGECNGCDVLGSASIQVVVTQPPCGYFSVLQTQTEATIPANRSRTKLGVGEKTTITLSPAPTCTVSWSITPSSGAGTFTLASNSSAIFTAHDRASNPTIKAQFGPNSDWRAVTYNVVEPTHETAVKQADLNEFNTNPPEFVGWQVGSAMYMNPVTLHPTDVSFYRVEIREESGQSATNRQGYFISPFTSNLTHQGATLWDTVLSGNTQDDTVIFKLPTTSPTPYAPGSFNFVIPTQWRVLNGASGPANLPNQVQSHSIDNANGQSTSTKFCVPGPCATVTRTPSQ